jgi:polyphosphate glucokinase
MSHRHPFTLCIDIGGTGIKMMVVDANDLSVSKYIRELTPRPPTVDAISNAITRMMHLVSVPFDRVTAGFPGVVQNGIIKTAHNIDNSWLDINLEQLLRDITNAPTRVANDADVQGYGDVSGQGVELVITLGTGVGSALFLNGQLVPNLELGHHPFWDNKTYEQTLGKIAIETLGVELWSINLKKAIQLLAQTFNYNKLYLGGGYAELINWQLPNDVILSKNIEGVLGGVKLWNVATQENQNVK